jgi:hypothetical protein
LVFVELVMNDILKGLKLVEKQQLAWAERLENYSDWYESRVFWDRTRDWNELCSWVVTQFGPPGDRYRTHPDFDSMLFLFRDSQDYVLFTLRWA